MSKNHVLAALLLYTISGHASSNESVVTKPYKPGFRDRYSTHFKAALTTTFALGAACAYTNRANLDKTSCAALGGAFLVYLHQMVRKPHLLDMLLTRPKAALDWGYSVRDKCGQEAEKTGAVENIETTKMLIDQYTKEQPLFLLGECVKEDWGHCLLSRIYKPKFRQQFESSVVTSLKNKLTSLARPVQYVSFGSGGMFQDHVILTKTLAKKPDAQLDVHLIDLKYTPYVKCRDLLNNTRLVDSHIDTDPTPVMEAFKKLVRDDKAVPESMGDEELTRVLMNVCLNHEVPAQQSLRWLAKTFPQAQLKLHLHDTADSYHQYIERTNTQSADVIATADIQDEMSLIQQAGPNYAQLCVQTLQKNPHADNIWLTKNPRQGIASLARIKLEESAEAEKHDAEVRGVSIPVYITSQQILASTSFLRRLIGR